MHKGIHKLSGIYLMLINSKAITVSLLNKLANISIIGKFPTAKLYQITFYVIRGDLIRTK